MAEGLAEVVFCSKEEFYSLYKDLLEKTQSFYMQVKGGSMYPFVRNGDSIEVLPLKQEYNNIKKGEIILFTRNNYFYVHRVIKKAGDNFITKGDFSFGTDGNIPKNDIFARVISVQRNGRKIHLHSKLNSFIGLFMASFGFFLQYIFLFFRKAIDFAIVSLSLIQGIKIYRRLIKKILNKNIVIRIAQLEDKEQLRDLYMVSNSDIEDGIINAEKDGFWLIAKKGEKLVASIAISRYEKNPELWIIHGLIVKPLFRGLGIGEKLVESTIIKAEENEALEIGLFINKKSKPALNLYKKIGFEINSNYPSEFNVADDELYLTFEIIS